jgi:hypothetical protein
VLRVSLAGPPRIVRRTAPTGGRRSAHIFIPTVHRPILCDPPRAAARTAGRGRRASRPRRAQGSVALSLCTAAHPCYTGFTNMFGASISEAKVRPNPRRAWPRTSRPAASPRARPPAGARPAPRGTARTSAWSTGARAARGSWSRRC